MYLKCHTRLKDGKEHRYWSIAERVHCSGGRRVERHVLYLGEINDSQREAWLRSISVFDADEQEQTRLALFPASASIPEHATAFAVGVRLAEFTIRNGVRYPKS